VTAPADWDVVQDRERSERPNVPWLDVDLTANEIYRDAQRPGQDRLV
jgi:hypothetical protein